MKHTDLIKRAKTRAEHLRLAADRVTADLLDELVTHMVKIRGASIDWVSTHRAGRECGVTAVTIIRWIETGKVPAFKTAGGHRRIRRDDLDKFKEQRGLGDQ